MRLRAAQFAFVMLLLSSLRAAGATTLRDGDRVLRTTYIGVLLHQQSMAQPEASPVSRHLDRLADADAALSPAPHNRFIETPAAQTAHVHAVTGSGL